MKQKIPTRISELQEELQVHQTRLNQAQQLINEESRQILAKQGAILELQKLLKVEEQPKKEKTLNNTNS